MPTARALGQPRIDTLSASSSHPRGATAGRAILFVAVLTLLLASCSSAETRLGEVPAGLQPSSTSAIGGGGDQPSETTPPKATCTNLRAIGEVPIASDSFWPAIGSAYIIVADGSPTWVAPANGGAVAMLTGGEDPEFEAFDRYDAAVVLEGKLYVGYGTGQAGAVAEVDRDTGAVLREFPVPGRRVDSDKAAAGLSAGLNHLWVFTDTGMAAINAANGAVVQFDRDDYVWSALDIQGTFSLPVAAGGRMWIATDEEFITGLSLDGSAEIVETGKNSLIPVVAGGLMYVSNFDSGTITVIDPEAAVVVDEIAVGSGPLWPTEIDGRLWVPNSLGDSITIINARSGGIDGELEVGAVPSHPLAVGDYVVAPAHGAGRITIFDRDTLEVHAVLDVEDNGTPADTLFYPSGHVDSLPLLKIGLPVAMDNATVAIQVFASSADGFIAVDLLAIDLPTGRVIDRYPDVFPATPIAVDGDIVVLVEDQSSWEATVLACS